MPANRHVGGAVVGWPVELNRVVPPSGSMVLAGKQFWIEPARSGHVVRFWASVDVIHLFIGGTPVKTVRSHFSVTDLARLVAESVVGAGPSPLHRSRKASLFRSNGLSPETGWSASAAARSWRRRSSAAVRSASGSSPTRWMFFDLTAESCAGFGRTPSALSRSAGTVGTGPPGHRRGPRPSRSGSSAGPRTAA